MKGRPPSRKSPREKKVLSYAKDCRNCHGESDKASRKAIPLRKAAERRRDRRQVNQVLHVLPGLDEGSAAVVESSASHDVNRVGGWSKAPDRPLAEHIPEQKKARRSRSKLLRRTRRRIAT